ncbi:MAG TPA: hypothetical protein VHJ56_01580, partial [Candidatus Binatia bacterium]|nr:hypothetical protein [Candidatus Binatia bacterium]
MEIDSCLIADTRLERGLDLAREWGKKLPTPVNEIELSLGEAEEELVLIGRSGEKIAPEDVGVNSLFLKRHSDVNGLILAGPSWRRAYGKTRVSLYAEEGVK